MLKREVLWWTCFGSWATCHVPRTRISWRRFYLFFFFFFLNGCKHFNLFFLSSNTWSLFYGFYYCKVVHSRFLSMRSIFLFFIQISLKELYFSCALLSSFFFHLHYRNNLTSSHSCSYYYYTTHYDHYHTLLLLHQCKRTCFSSFLQKQSFSRNYSTIDI